MITKKETAHRHLLEGHGDMRVWSKELLQDKDLCTMGVGQNGLSLQYVPEELRDEEMCVLAVSNDGLALSYVPDELKTKDLCALAVLNEPLAVRYVPDEFFDHDMCIFAEKALAAHICKSSTWVKGYPQVLAAEVEQILMHHRFKTPAESDHDIML